MSSERVEPLSLRRRLVTVCCGLVLGVISLVGVPTTHGALTSSIRNPTNTAASSVFSIATTCQTAVSAASAYFIYALGDAAGATTAADTSGGNRSGTYRSTAAISYRQSGPCPRDNARAVTINPRNNDTAFISGPSGTVTGPQTFTVQTWFKTGSTRGGRLIGFGNGTGTTESTSYDRHLYLTNAGKVVFAVRPNTFKAIATPAGYNDNDWHHAVGTLSSNTGLRLYIDGTLIATDATTTTAQAYTGQWRIGWDNLASNPEVPTSERFQGSLAWSAVHNNVLTAAQVQAIYTAGE